MVGTLHFLFETLEEADMGDTIRYTLAAAIATLMATAAPVRGQQPDTRTPPPMDTQKTMKFDADRTFLMTAGQGGHAEVVLANLAMKKASNDEVKKLAQLLEKDHTANNRELVSLAASKGVVVATLLDAEHQQLHDRLAKLDGAAFDRAYSTAMVDGHKKMIALFEQASVSKDAQVKAFAEKTLPALREHLKHAQHAQSTTGGGTSTSGSAPARPETAPK
jgi:putative membrane protein